MDLNSQNAFTLGTSAYLTLQSLPLLFTPRLIFTLLSAESRRISSFEIYLSRSFAFALLTLAALNLLLSGLIPLKPSSTSASYSATKSVVASPQDLYARPTLLITTLYHTSVTTYLYATITTAGPGVGLIAGVVMSGSLAVLGAWTLVFGGEAPRLSKSTGADKRTGNFPFRNSESAREVKRREREREKERKGEEKERKEKEEREERERKEREKAEKKEKDREERRERKERESAKEKDSESGSGVEKKRRSVLRTRSERG